VLDAGFFPRVTTAATDNTANLIIHTLFGASNAPHHQGAG
jgi:hypothetical protein